MDELIMVELKPASSHIPSSCLYCNRKLPAKTKEHIFNAAWGGSHASSKLICDVCNGTFSKEIDNAFTSIVEKILNAWNIKLKRKKQVPILKAGENISLHGFGIAKWNQPIIDIKTKGNYVEFNIKANSKSEIKRLLNDGIIESQVGRKLSDEQKNEFIRKLSDAQYTITQGEWSLGAEINLDFHYRSAIHTIFKTLLHFTPVTFKEIDFKNAIDFVHKGVGSWQDFAILAEEFLTIPIDDPIFNATTIYFNKKHKRVIGSINLLNRLRLFVDLAPYTSETDVVIIAHEGLNGDPRFSGIFTQIPSHMRPMPFVTLLKKTVTHDEIMEEYKKSLSVIMYKDKFEIAKRITSAAKSKSGTDVL